MITSNEVHYTIAEAPLYVNEMNQVMDSYLSSPNHNYLPGIFYTPVDKIPSLIHLCCRKIIKESTTLQQIPVLPEVIQQLILQNACNLTQWSKIRAYCTYKAIQDAAIQILDTQNTDLREDMDREADSSGTSTISELTRLSYSDELKIKSKSEERLLSYIFDIFIKTANKENLTLMLKTYGKTKNINLAPIQTKLEQSGLCLANVLRHPQFNNIVNLCAVGVVGVASLEILGKINRIRDTILVSLLSDSFGYALLTAGAIVIFSCYYKFGNPNSIIYRVSEFVIHFLLDPRRISTICGPYITRLLAYVNMHTIGISLTGGNILKEKLETSSQNLLTNEIKSARKHWIDCITQTQCEMLD